MNTAKACVLLLIATIVAVAFRAPQIERRPFHTDEAVHAVKFGDLLERNEYIYDPHEYHGPTLNYFTLIPAWIAGTTSYADLDEGTLRAVPIFFGVLLVVLLFGLGRNGLGWPAAVAAAFLTAVSPAFVFYSRYYIQEVLLVCFTCGAILAGFHWFRKKSPGWALLTGLFLGLMFATKETCVIAFGAMGGGLVLAAVLSGQPVEVFRNTLDRKAGRHLLLMVGAALGISALFFSSFFSNPQGVVDSFLTYKVYLDRAGNNEIHNHPWHYYLSLLAGYRFEDGPLFTEIWILLLAVVGGGAILFRRDLPGVNRGLLRFLLGYTVLMTLVYSTLSYKTPWCMLGFLHGMILLAGVGVGVLFQLRHKGLRRILGGLVVAGLVHLSWLACSANFSYAADVRNPYVYGHTGDDVFEIAERVQSMADVHPDGKAMPVQVIVPAGQYWPLPWYLRGYRVGYYNEVPLDDGAVAAPVVLIHPSQEEDLMKKLYEFPPPGQKEMYMYLYYEDGKLKRLQLRPGLEIRGFVAKSLWDLAEESRQKAKITPADNEPASN